MQISELHGLYIHISVRHAAILLRLCLVRHLRLAVWHGLLRDRPAVSMSWHRLTVALSIIVAMTHVLGLRRINRCLNRLLGTRRRFYRRSSFLLRRLRFFCPVDEHVNHILEKCTGSSCIMVESISSPIINRNEILISVSSGGRLLTLPRSPC